MSLVPRRIHEKFAKLFNKILESEGQGDLKYEINPDAEYGTMVDAGPVPRMPLSKQHIEAGHVPNEDGLDVDFRVESAYPHPLDDSKGYFFSGVDPASGEDVEATMVMVEKAYLKDVGEMVEVHGRLKEAWGEICQTMFDRFELDYGDFFELGEKYGLLREEVFDPAVHGEHFDGEPGDPIYFNALQEDTNATANDKD